MLGHLERRFGPFFVTIKLRYYNISHYFFVARILSGSFSSFSSSFGHILISDVKQIWFVSWGCVESNLVKETLKELIFGQM